MTFNALADSKPRISSNTLDLGKADPIYLSPGLVSLIDFPRNIIEVRVGNPNSLKALISQVSPRELTLYLTSSDSLASNLIVRAEKKVFVFDIIPSKTNHQDYIKINSSYGSPISNQHEISSNKIKLHPEIKTTPQSFTLKKTKSLKVGP